MICRLKCGIIELCPNTEIEERFLCLPETKSKIAYVVRKFSTGGLTISTECENTVFDVCGGYTSFNWCNWSNKKRMYYLRAVLEQFAALSGAISMHASALAFGTYLLIVFGDSLCGKSTIAAILSSKYGAELIGDDHIILSPYGIVGNSVMRLRKGDDTIYCEHSLKYFKYKRLCVAHIELADDGNNCNSIEVDSVESFEKINDALKYLYEPLNKYKMDAGAFDFSEAFKAYLRYLHSASSFIRIHGNSIYIAEILSKL